MSKIGQYLLSVVAAAVIVAISNTLIDKKGAIGSILKLITGVVLSMVIVSPWTDLRFNDFEHLYSYTETDALSLVAQGQETAQSEISAYIKTQMQAYILDKASNLGLDITVDVILTEEAPPSVETVRITGIGSPYAKQRLMQIVCTEFGVAEECLIWS